MKKTSPFILPAMLMGGCMTNNPDTASLKSDNIGSNHPNVLFIAVDDLRDWTGYLGEYSTVKTPNLDKLAKAGMVFTNAHCAAPVCSPSRTALLTGISPANTGVYENGNRWEGDLREHVTLTRYFMDMGYYVAGFGKIYHGSGDLQYWHRFEYGEYSPAPKNPEYPGAFGSPLDIPDSLTGDWKRVTNAIEIIEKDIQTPLFLACGLVRPHTPWDVPRKYFEMYPLESIKLPEVNENDQEDIPFMGKAIANRKMGDNYGKYRAEWTHQQIVDSGLWKVNIQAYLASISYADDQIGRLMEAWNKSKYAENGIIVLWGDHGWHLGEKQHWSKRTLWEVGTRTPLIFSYPGKIESGSTCETPVSLLDLFPTLTELCKLPPRKDLDGISLTPLLFNPDLPWDRPAVTIWGQDNVSVRSGQWRYIHYCDGSKELYDHRNDPNEWENLAGSEYMHIINQLHQWVPDCVPATSIRKRSWFEENNLICD